MKKKLLKFLKYIGFLTLGIFLFWLAIKDFDRDELIGQIKNADPTWILWSLFFMLAAHVSRAHRWTLLIGTLGHKLSLFRSFIAVMIGYIANIAFPRMGEVSKCAVLNQTNNIKINQLFGTVLIERVVDTLCLLTVLILTFLLEYERLFYFYVVNIHDQITPLFNWWNLLTIIGLIALFIMLYKIWEIKSKGENPLIIKIRGFLGDLKKGFASLKEMPARSQLIFWGHSVFIWLMYWAMTYVVFFSFENLKNTEPVAGLTSLAVGSLGFVMPVQGGIGTYHWAVKEGLRLYDIPTQLGMSYATVVHGSQALATILVGLLAFLALFFVKKNAKTA